MEYKDLRITVITKEKHLQTCNYWYLVTSGTTSHTAYTTEKGLMRWLNERGLKLTAPLTPPGIFSTQKINGSYYTKMHNSHESLGFIRSIINTKTLSNGDYVNAFITEDEKGIRTVHTLNPNVKNRHVYNYQETAKEMR